MLQPPRATRYTKKADLDYFDTLAKSSHVDDR
jgi:hypothetical protein